MYTPMRENQKFSPVLFVWIIFSHAVRVSPAQGKIKISRTIRDCLLACSFSLGSTPMCRITYPGEAKRHIKIKTGVFSSPFKAVVAFM
ncbi:hypothetical protein F5Y17DRAFT_137925 [Xylariaceae sp. FL0594]|nr:hypothetical protein F5Y17DRAFT_137925 [Xylariaceae sp. FL0594]